MEIDQGEVFISRWCQDLKKSLQSENPNYESVFFPFAQKLMCKYLLRVNSTDFELTELEFYLFDQVSHPDPYVHCHCLQLQCGKLYVHESWGKRGGIDLSFGNGIYYGGILIRGIKKKDDNGQFIAGPAKCRDTIKDAINFKISTYNELQNELNKQGTFSIVESTTQPCSVYKSTRIIPNTSTCDVDYHYINKFYRFIRDDHFQKKGVDAVREKTKIKISNHPSLDACNEKSEIKDYCDAYKLKPISKKGILWAKIKHNFLNCPHI